MGQGMLADSKSWKSQKIDSALEPQEINATLQHLDFSPVKCEMDW